MHADSNSELLLLIALFTTTRKETEEFAEAHTKSEGSYSSYSDYSLSQEVNRYQVNSIMQNQTN